MAKFTLTLKLTGIAKAKGGDRYQAYLDGEVRPLVIYLPQNITRDNGSVAKEFEMTLEN